MTFWRRLGISGILFHSLQLMRDPISLSTNLTHDNLCRRHIQLFDFIDGRDGGKGSRRPPEREVPDSQILEPATSRKVSMVPFLAG